MNYFWDKSCGLNFDIERHRVEEAKYLSKISELESKIDKTEMDIKVLNVNRHLLSLLQQSKANVTSKIGRTK